MENDETSIGLNWFLNAPKPVIPPPMRPDPYGCNIGNFSNFTSDGIMPMVRPVPHWPVDKCLFYEGKWRLVCKTCGKVEMEDGWRKL